MSILGIHILIFITLVHNNTILLPIGKLVYPKTLEKIQFHSIAPVRNRMKVERNLLLESCRVSI